MRLIYLSADPGIDPFGRKGASTHVRETCRALLALGHEVLLLAAKPSGGYPGEAGASDPESFAPNDPLRKLRVEWIEAPAARWLGFDGRRIVLSHRIAGALAMLGMGDFRAEALYERYALYQDTGLEYAEAAGWPRALEVNTLLAKEQANRLKLPWLARRVERRIWRSAPLIVTLSHTLRKRIEGELGLTGDTKSRFLISPMAVDPERFDAKRVVPDAELLRLAAGRPVVGYVGSLGGWHGADLLTRVAAKLTELGSDALVVAVGDTPERVARVAALAETNGASRSLALRPSVDHSRVPGILAACDVCLIPDTQDWSVPTKLFEYGAMGKPIVAAGRPVVEEFVVSESSDSPWARTFTPGDAEACAQAILTVLSDRKSAARMADDARRIVLKHHTWEANARDLVAALQNARTQKDPA